VERTVLVPASAVAHLAAAASVCLIALVVAFQVALAAGARWEAAAYGGRFVQGEGPWLCSSL
jgi:hypothetical protein